MKHLLILLTLPLLISCGTNNDVVDPPVTPDPVPVLQTCGGILGEICADPNDYCYHSEGVCLQIADAQGECREKPQICTQEYAPVCGCDGQTYSNSCAAAGAGTSVASQGECP